MRRIAALLVALVLTSAASAGTKLSETIDRTLDVKPGATLELRNVNGPISISSWDQPRVRVLAYKNVEADRDEAPDVLRELRVEIAQTGGGVRVITHHPRREEGSIFDWILGGSVSAQVRYEVTVPREMNLDLTNTNGGIRVFGVRGKHDLDTTNGKIEVGNCGGSLDASTTNGTIAAELTTIAPGTPLRFETTNGKIEVSVPGNFAAEIDASTTNGEIRSDLPVATTRSSKNSLRGTINGGGTPVKLRTTNGGIAIRVAGRS